ncbi:MAG: outer membrane protein/peptidoglycan-associated protein [Bacteroidetes bacterium]|nr:outer membrane protein/peptidoglycan-associated protein [Bacteroidota bacterium]
MKKVFSSLLFFAFTVCLQGQINVTQKIKDKVTEKANQKTEEAIDKTLDEAEDGATKPAKSKKEESQNEDESVKEGGNPAHEGGSKNEPATESKTAAGAQPKIDEFKSYSKFDFVAGEKIVYYDDFSHTAVGDFPANWNTSGSGEVTTTNSVAGKWLKLQNGQIYFPEINTKLPENYTLEFNVIVTGNDIGDGQLGSLTTFFAATKPNEAKEPVQPAGNLDYYGSSSAKVAVDFANANHAVISIQNQKNNESGGVNSQINDDILKGKIGKVIRFSFTVQKQRLRFYIDDKKVIDQPKMFPQGDIYDRILFEMWGFSDNSESKQNVYLSNIRLAVGMPDMRSRLMTDGKLVTRGITFNSGSDKIKPESYGTMKEIAAVLKDNPAIKVKIVGHTDNDGTAASNLELSKKRSVAVKNSLVKDFGIDASKLETDGKGQSEPSGPNTTSEGKANNRRVEFIKL